MCKCHCCACLRNLDLWFPLPLKWQTYTYGLLATYFAAMGLGGNVIDLFYEKTPYFLLISIAKLIVCSFGLLAIFKIQRFIKLYWILYIIAYASEILAPFILMALRYESLEENWCEGGSVIKCPQSWGRESRLFVFLLFHSIFSALWLLMALFWTIRYEQFYKIVYKPETKKKDKKKDDLEDIDDKESEFFNHDDHNAHNIHRNNRSHRHHRERDRDRNMERSHRHDRNRQRSFQENDHEPSLDHRRYRDHYNDKDGPDQQSRITRRSRNTREVNRLQGIQGEGQQRPRRRGSRTGSSRISETERDITSEMRSTTNRSIRGMD